MSQSPIGPQVKMRAPTGWLALVGLSTFLAALPVRVEGQSPRQPNQAAQQTTLAQVPTAAMPNLVGLSIEAARKQPAVG
jgi:hypothetical protein